MRMFLGAVVLVSLAVAAAGCLPRPAGPVAPAAGAPLPFYPMSLVFVGPREAGEPIGGLLADGSIVSRHRGVVARLLPDRVVAPDGRPKIIVAPNGDVWLDPQQPPMRFDARDALVSPKGEAIWVDDAGTPSWSEPGGRGLPSMEGVRFAPFTPAARRTAEVLLIIIMEAAWSRGMT
jgi:hypothetical protein